MTRKRKLAVILAGATAALVFGSLGWAAIPDGGGVINGCYDKQSGQLRVTDTQTGQPKACTAKETALAWGQQGPPGPKGDRGPSDGYAQIAASTALPAAQQTTVGQLDLPAGPFLVSAKLSVQTSTPSSGPAVVHCLLWLHRPGGDVYDHAWGTISSDGNGEVLVTTLALERAFDSVGGLTASVSCTSPVAATARYVEIQATQVGTLH